MVTKVQLFSQTSKEKWVSWKHTAPYIASNAIAIIDLILDTHFSEYIWLAFYMFNAFRQVCVI